MSRGARGTGRGGRGAFRGRGGKATIGGLEVSWDYDEETEKAIKTRPQETFPAIPDPAQTKPPTRNERLDLEYLRAFRRSVHDGPLHTILGDDMRAGKQQLPKGARFDPFHGMPTYAQKYKRQTRKLANFSTRKYSLRFFPQELWDVIDSSRSTKSSTSRKASANLERVQQLSRLDAIEDEEGKNDDEEGEQNKADSDVDMRSDDPDEDFSDDSEDMAPDYNAENYFETGDDDGDDLGGDDGGGDDDYD